MLHATSFAKSLTSPGSVYLNNALATSLEELPVVTPVAFLSESEYGHRTFLVHSELYTPCMIFHADSMSYSRA